MRHAHVVKSVVHLFDGRLLPLIGAGHQDGVEGDLGKPTQVQCHEVGGWACATVTFHLLPTLNSGNSSWLYGMLCLVARGVRWIPTPLNADRKSDRNLTAWTMIVLRTRTGDSSDMTHVSVKN